MRASYDHYRIFYHVAKSKSFTQAAARLMSNQPNVTRAIKALEISLGCVLFVRSRHGVTLTPEGEKLFAHVKVAFEHIEAAEEEIASSRGMTHGVISIGTSDIALRCMLLPVLKQYRKLYPGIRIKVSNYSTPEALAALKEGRVDIATVTLHSAVSLPFKSTEIKQIEETAIASEAFSELRGKELSLSELANHPLISLGTHTKTYAFYSEFFMQHGVVFSPTIEAATADQILPLVKNDLGIGFVPKPFLAQYPQDDSVFLLKLKEEIPKRSICLIKRTDISLSIAAKKLNEMILAEKSRS